MGVFLKLAIADVDELNENRRHCSTRYRE